MIRYFLMVFLLLTGFAVTGQDNTQVKNWGLQECIDRALEKNLTLQQAKLNVNDQEINLKQAKADLFPTLNAGGNYGFNWGRGIDPTSNLFINERVAFTGYSVSSRATLFAGFQRQHTIKQNAVNLEASKNDFEDAKNDISLNIALLYLNVIFNKELLSNNRSQVASTEQQLQRTNALVEAGSLPYSNLLTLQSQLASNEAIAVNAENNLNLSILDLKQALQINASEEFDIVVPDLDVNQQGLNGLDLEEIYRISLANQPDVKSADLNVRSAVHGEKIAKGALYPSISVNGSLGSNYSDARDRARTLTEGTTTETRQIGFVQSSNEPVFAELEVPNVVGVDSDYSVSEQFSDNFNQQLTLNLSVPIFNGFNARNNIQRSKINKHRAEISAKQTRQTLRQVIEKAFNDAVAAAKNYEASVKQVEALSETYRIATEQLEVQAINSVDYQIAENNLFQAQSDMVRNKYDYIFKTKILDFYQGKPITF